MPLVKDISPAADDISFLVIHGDLYSHKYIPLPTVSKPLYETFVGMLTADNAPIEDVIRIREKQFAAMERVMVFAESDDVHKEQIRTTYKTDDLISWHLNRLLYSPHPQYAKLRKNPKYMEMLNKWAR